jgi:cytochrome c-type biogenesis protein CcmH/NrfF
MDDTRTVSRRGWLAAGLGALVVRPRAGLAAAPGHDREHANRDPSAITRTQLSQVPQEVPVPRLKSPGTAGRPRARVIAGDNDPFIIEIEHRLKCNCGCAHSLYACRTTDFNCGYWQALHAEVIAMAEQDMTAEEIIDAYVKEHGEVYLMAPVPEGFNLTGYFLPGIVIAGIAGAMVWILRRRTEVAAAGDAAGAAALGDQDLARLEAELRDLET